MMSKEKYIAIGIIIVLGFLVYSNSLNNEFIWDDSSLITRNTYIKNWSNLSGIFTGSLRGGSGGKDNVYRPLQTFTYMIDYSLCGLNVKGYHLSNILLHILTALAIYWLVTILYDDRFLSLFTGMLFVVHPVHTEAVTYISGRADPLAVLFMLLCLIFYIKHLHTESMTVYILMLSSCVLALLSRENSLILPAILLLYHYTFKKRLKLAGILSIITIAFIYVVLRLTALSPLLSRITYTTTAAQRLPGFFVAITDYTRLLFAPFNLHMEYGNRLFHFPGPKAILGIIISSSLLVYAFRIKKADRLIFFSISWFFITILPQSNLYPINAYMAEHWLYLPSIGFFLLLAKGLSVLYRKRKYQILTVVFTVSLLAFYSYLTIRQNTYWREPVTFYKRTLQYTPGSSRAYNNLGKAYGIIGKEEEAIAAFKKAMEINPRHTEVYNNLGNVYSNIGKNKEAIRTYQKAAEIDPHHAVAYYNLAVVYGNMGRKKKAIALYEKTIEINPNYAEAYYNLGNIYNSTGSRGKAMALYKKAIGLNPDYVDAYNNLAGVYVAIGRKEEALRTYQKAIKINPNHAGAHSNLAVLYFNQKRYGLAIKHYDRAIELGYKVHPGFLEELEPYITRDSD